MTTPPDYAWTDQTYLLFKNHVSWKCYVQSGTEPDCADDAADCPPVNQNGKTPSIWNPLPSFDTVKEDRQLPNITDVTNFYRDAKAGTLPAVSWITPSGPNSEHPPALLSDGQAWTTSLINAAMQGPEWDSAVIFLSWDDWGGFYDHVQAYVKFIEDDFLGGQRIDPSTDGPTRVRMCAKTRRSSAIWRSTSTSASRRARRWCCPFTRRPASPSIATPNG